MKYLIACSGLGDTWEYLIEECENDEDASKLAWGLACNQYESYEGMHGIRDLYDIMEDENCSEEDAFEIYNEERESWIDYWVTSDIETKVNELLENGFIDSINEIGNYESLRN